MLLQFSEINPNGQTVSYQQDLLIYDETETLEFPNLEKN